MNNTVLIGRLTKDPEMRVLQSGTQVTRFTVAVDRNMSREKKEQAKAQGRPTADFVPVTVWGAQAEACAKYLSKGRMVAVSGRITTDSYETDGQRVYTTEVTAERVQFLDGGQGQQKPVMQETDAAFPWD